MRAPILALALVLTSAGAGTASATPQRGVAARPKRARPQRVVIQPGSRAATIPRRAFTLPRIARLPAHRSDVANGLLRYRRIRTRVRDLRQRARSVRVSHLLKTDSFIVDRLDFRKQGGKRKPRVLVIGGVHAGSERVGVESAMRIAELGDALANHVDLTVIPLANPTSLVIRSRRDANDVDANRTFAKGSFTRVTRALATVIHEGHYDLILDLHGAGSSRTGAFAIRGADDNGFAQRFMATALPAHRLLDRKGAGKTYDLDAPGVVTSNNSGTLKQYGVTSGTVRSYTIEATARHSGQAQVAGTVDIVRAAIAELVPMAR